MLKKFKSLKANKKGFTLAELLIVVAIIAVLAAIAIPVFAAQLNQAKLRVDQANARSAESIASADWLLHQDDTDYSVADNKIVYYSVTWNSTATTEHNMTVAKVENETVAKTKGPTSVTSQLDSTNVLYVKVDSDGAHAAWSVKTPSV